MERITDTLLLIANNTKIVPCLVGEKGTGKSAYVRQLANNYFDGGFVDLRLNVMEVGDLLGNPINVTKPDGSIVAEFSRPGWMPSEGRGILFLDEINRARPSVHQAIFQLLLDRCIHNHKMAEGWIIVAAMNPPNSNYNTTDISDHALMDRLAFMKFDPSVEEWLEYAKTAGISKEAMAFAKEFPNMLEPKSEGFTLEATSSYRSFTFLDSVYRKIKDEPNALDRLRPVGYALCGPVTTTAFLGHIDKFFSLLKPQDILTYNKETKKTVTKIVKNKENDTLVTIIDNLTSYLEKTKTMSKEEQDAFIEFLHDIPKEIAMKTLMADVFNENYLLDSALIENKKFRKYYSELINGDVTKALEFLEEHLNVKV